MPHPYGWLSLLPPLVAVVLAITTQRILASLLAGLLAGALLTTGGDVPQAVIDLFEVHLWPTFADPDKLRLFAFTITMGAMVGLLHAAGGMRAFVELFTRWAAGRRSGQLTGWAMGLVVFFDDYANTLLLGGALRGVYDRLRISREKLAYLVDSTAAPVAGLSLISTWVAVEIGYVQEGVDNLTLPGGEPASAFSLFVACLPYRFYIIQALLFVPIVALIGRDFGPMLAAERRAIADKRAVEGSPKDHPANNHRAADADTDDAQADDATVGRRRANWLHAVVPLAVMLLSVLVLLWSTGVRNLGDDASAAGGLGERMRQVLGASSSTLALQYGALAGLAVALLMTTVQRLLPAAETRQALVRGVLTVLPAIAILWFAAAMSRMTGNNPSPADAGDPAPATAAADDADEFPYASHRLYTAEFLSEQILGPDTTEPTALVRTALPTGVFLLSAVVAFCTGTSFGTMGLVVPIVVPLAASAAGGTADALATPLVLASLGGVLSGAIFGDHCSPISDTTILSSQACACDHMAHVRTQLPYALVIAAVCVVLGTVPIGLGISVWLLLPLQTAALIALLIVLGRRVDDGKTLA